MENIRFFGFAFAILSVKCISGPLEKAKCPQHKPFYTEVGCVYMCPNDFYINGSSCVVTCGDWFTSINRECQSECSDGYFIKELVRAIGLDPYLERQCVAACDSSEFILNRTCVEACPTHLKYIVNQNCVQICPDEFPLLKNFTKGGILYHKCFETCPHYEEDNYCAQSCSEGKLLFSSRCIDTCPQSHQYIHDNQCFTQCPSWRPLDASKTCVSKCPLNLPFIHNSSCVANCPKEFPLSDMRVDGSKVCVDVCGQVSEKQFLYNNTCVSKCPNFALNKTCVDICPYNHLTVNNVTVGKNCRYDDTCTKVLQYSECVEECSSEKFLLPEQNACVENCPSNMVLLNRTCLHSCDEKTPYSEVTTVDVTFWSNKEYIYTLSGYRLAWKKISEKHTARQCVNDCSDDNLKLNYSCVQRCPGLNDMPINLEDLWNETSQYFRYNKTCVKKCPENHKFVGRSYVKERKENCWSRTCIKIIWYLECLAECPENTYMYRNLCFSFCPDHLFLLGKTCIAECPQKQHLHLKREINVVLTESEHTMKKTIFECVATCDEKIISNNTCVDFCPVNEPYLNSNICHKNSCGTLYELQTWKGITCRMNCPKGTLYNVNACIVSCPEEKVTHDGKCLKICPQSHPYKIPTEAISQVWRSSEKFGWRYRNTTAIRYICSKSCPSDKVLDKNNTCVDNCPVNETYLNGIICHNNACGTKYEFNTSKGIECLTKCPNDTMHSANKCTAKCPDELKYNLNSVCVKECPSSSPFVVNTSNIFLSLFGIGSELKCIDACEDKELYLKDEERCIYSFSCLYPYFEYAGQCLKSCPNGYKWFLSCFHWTAALVFIPVMTLLTLIYILCCLPLFKEVYLFIKKCRQYTKQDHGEDNVENVLRLRGNEETRNGIELEDTPDIDITDTFVLSNSSYRNNALETETTL